jgi:hypothetical protein
MPLLLLDPEVRGTFFLQNCKMVNFIIFTHSRTLFGDVQTQLCSFFNLGARWGVVHAPATLPPGNRPSTHCTESWVGLRVRLDGHGKYPAPNRVWTLDCPIHSKLLYWLHYPGCHAVNYLSTINLWGFMLTNFGIWFCLHVGFGEGGGGKTGGDVWWVFWKDYLPLVMKSESLIIRTNNAASD